MFVEKLTELEYIIKPWKKSFNWDETSPTFQFFRCIMCDVVTYLTEVINESMSTSHSYFISIFVQFYLLQFKTINQNELQWFKDIK